MCSIRYYDWRALGRTGPCPLLGPPEHLDHDHAAGLIRGLLCTRCNTFSEPIGARHNEDVRQAYIASPPARTLHCDWPYK